MIRAGRPVADDARAAQLMGKAVGTLRNKKLWRLLEPAIVSRPQARYRLYDEELLQLVLDSVLPALSERRELTAQERRMLADARRQLDQCEDRDEDLLDVEEAWMAIPPQERPTWASWKSYVSTGVGPAPDQDPDRDAPGVHFYRSTITRWCANRHQKPVGRPAGSADRAPRDLSGDVRHQQAEQHRARVRALLADCPRPTGEQLTELADELALSRRHIERLLAEVRSAA